MKVTILGNNSALQAFGRHPTAQAVSVFNELLLIDCGEGTQGQLQRYGIKWRNLHHIFISHMHGDHYFGLPGIINSMSLLGRSAPLHLFAPAALQPIIEAILNVADTTLSYPLLFHPLPEGAAVLVDEPLFTVTCFPVMHRIHCHGFLIEKKSRGRKILPDKCADYCIPHEAFESLKEGADYHRPDGTLIKNEWVTDESPKPKRYAYCADTIYTESILEWISGVDLLYHESTYLEEDREKAALRYHTTALQAAQIAQLARVGQLLLGHFSSKYKDLEPFRVEASAFFPNVMISVEGNTYDV